MQSDAVVRRIGNWWARRVVARRYGRHLGSHQIVGARSRHETRTEHEPHDRDHGHGEEPFASRAPQTRGQTSTAHSTPPPIARAALALSFRGFRYPPLFHRDVFRCLEFSPPVPVVKGLHVARLHKLTRRAAIRVDDRVVVARWPGATV